MAVRFGGTPLVAAALVFAYSCAEGMPGPDEFGSRLPLANASGQFPATAVDAGTTPEATMPPPAFNGTPCMMNERADCACSDGVSAGVQMCQFNMQSPTKGSWGPCTQCKAPSMEPPDAGGDVTMAGAGGSIGSANGGMGGSAGASGMAGMSGMGGMGGMAGSMMPACDPDDCPPTTGLFGIERDPCCTRRGECGGINALTGSCETD